VIASIELLAGSIDATQITGPASWASLSFFLLGISWRRVIRKILLPTRTDARVLPRPHGHERAELKTLRSNLENCRLKLAASEKRWAPAFQRFMAIDVETTGRGLDDPRIIQLGISRFDRGRFEALLSLYIDPGIKIGVSSNRKHNLTDDDLRNRGNFRRHAARIRSLLEGQSLVGHNVMYDIDILKFEFKRLGEEIDLRPLFCTMKRRWRDANIEQQEALVIAPGRPRYLSEERWHTLMDAAREHGLLSLGRLHDAAYDAHLAGEVFIEMARRELRVRKEEFDAASINLATASARAGLGPTGL
jgi:DNA polymerase III epsilon subunit-like protein